MSPIPCPRCGSVRTSKAGRNHSGSHRYYCAPCQRYFTPQPKEQGHGATVHEQAVRLYLEGMRQRAIGRLLGVVHQSVANWITAHAVTVPADPTDHPPPDEEGEGTVEVDELATFIGGKKQPDQRDARGGTRHAADRRATGDVGG